MTAITSPHQVRLHEIQYLSGTNDAVAVSVHQDGEDVLCNTWIKENDEWQHLLPERVSKDENAEPDYAELAGETVRAENSSELWKRDDMRIYYALAEIQRTIRDER